jgi:hypothetical protein
MIYQRKRIVIAAGLLSFAGLGAYAVIFQDDTVWIRPSTGQGTVGLVIEGKGGEGWIELQNADGTATLEGDDLGRVSFVGYSTEKAVGAQVVAVSTGEWGDSGAQDSPTDLVFYTAPDGGEAAERMRLTSDGRLEVSDTVAVGEGIEFQNSGGAGITATSSGDIVIRMGS